MMGKTSGSRPGSVHRHLAEDKSEDNVKSVETLSLKNSEELTEELI